MSRKGNAVATCSFCGFRPPYDTRGSDDRAIERMRRHPDHKCIAAWRRLLRRLVPVMLRER